MMSARHLRRGATRGTIVLEPGLVPSAAGLDADLGAGHGAGLCAGLAGVINRRRDVS